MTHTYAVLEVSAAAYAEVRALLAQAGYRHAFHETQAGQAVIDMHGIALAAQATTAPASESEERLTRLMDEAFAVANHPAMLDWVNVLFELRRLRTAAARQRDLLFRVLQVFEADPDVPGTELLLQVRAALSDRRND